MAKNQNSKAGTKVGLKIGSDKSDTENISINNDDDKSLNTPTIETMMTQLLLLTDTLKEFKSEQIKFQENVQSEFQIVHTAIDKNAELNKTISKNINAKANTNKDQDITQPNKTIGSMITTDTSIESNVVNKIVSSMKETKAPKYEPSRRDVFGYIQRIREYLSHSDEDHYDTFKKCAISYSGFDIDETYHDYTTAEAAFIRANMTTEAMYNYTSRIATFRFGDIHKFKQLVEAFIVAYQFLYPSITVSTEHLSIFALDICADSRRFGLKDKDTFKQKLINITKKLGPEDQVEHNNTKHSSSYKTNDTTTKK